MAWRQPTLPPACVLYSLRQCVCVQNVGDKRLQRSYTSDIEGGTEGSCIAEDHTTRQTQKTQYPQLTQITSHPISLHKLYKIVHFVYGVSVEIILANAICEEDSVTF